MGIDSRVQYYYNGSSWGISTLIAVLACADFGAQPGQLDAL